MTIYEGVLLFLHILFISIVSGVAAIWFYVRMGRLERLNRELEQRTSADFERIEIEKKTIEKIREELEKRIEDVELQRKMETKKGEVEQNEAKKQGMNQEDVTEKEPEELNADLSLFRPAVPLEMILNYLDARSFLRASATCRRMRSFCLSSKQLRVDGENLYLEAETTEDNDFSLTLKKKVKLDDGVEGKQRIIAFERLKRLPILFYFEISFFGADVSKENLETVKEFLASFRLPVVDLLFIGNAELVEWPEVVSFIRSLSVSSFESNEAVPSDIHNDLLSLPIESLSISGTVDVRHLRNSAIPTIFFCDARFTVDKLELLVEHWLTKTDKGNVLKWTFDCDFDSTAYREFFSAPRFRTVRMVRDDEPKNRPLAISTGNNSFLIVPKNAMDLFAISFAPKRRRITFIGNNDEVANAM